MTIERVSYWTCEYLENVWFWGVGFLNLVLFNSFHNRVEFGTILEGVRKFGGGVGRVDHLKPSLGTPLVGNLWFCDFWLLSLWVTERVCCRKTCDFVGYAYSACELSKNVWFCELCILNLSYWPCEMLKNCVFLMSYACWACVFFFKNVWFCALYRLSVWVIVGVISSDIIRYCVCVCGYVVVVDSSNYWASLWVKIRTSELMHVRKFLSDLVTHTHTTNIYII